jgi:hypothetical protein
LVGEKIREKLRICNQIEGGRQEQCLASLGQQKKRSFCLIAFSKLARNALSLPVLFLPHVIPEIFYLPRQQAGRGSMFFVSTVLIRKPRNLK